MVSVYTALDCVHVENDFLSIVQHKSRIARLELILAPRAAFILGRRGARKGKMGITERLASGHGFVLAVLRLTQDITYLPWYSDRTFLITVDAGQHRGDSAARR